MIAAPVEGLAGLHLLSAQPHQDARGFFGRLYCEASLRAAGLEPCGRQWSLSYNVARGTLRGMHFQADPHAETKIVRCVRGAIFDVAVDVRKDSPSFGRWFGVELTDRNFQALYIPPGFAHGFQTLTDDAEVLYAISPDFVADAARALRFDDPAVGIAWPLPPVAVSPRDAAAPLLAAL